MCIDLDWVKIKLSFTPIHYNTYGLNDHAHYNGTFAMLE
jgi:hypothetical protein